MKNLLTIRDEDVRSDYVASKETDYKIRISPRAVLFDENNKIALLNVSKHNYYKLPGGGAEEGEDIKTALARECLEEAGCNIEVLKEIGETVEYRAKWSTLQKSPSYIARVVGEKGKTNFEGDEIDYGFELLWVDFDKAFDLIKKSQPNDDTYDAKFIVKRDLAILEEAKKLI